MKQQLVKASATDEVELEVWDHNVQVVPTAALISLVINGETDVSLVSATISAAGTCTYVPGATVLDELSENSIADWELTIAGETKKFRQLFDVVLHPLVPAVTDEDLIAECAQLQVERYRESGLADSGNTVSVVSVLLREYPDNYFQGGTLEIVDGACAGQKQRISGSARSTGTITVDTAFGSALNSTSRFVAQRTFQNEIDRAWEDILAMIQSKGYRPALIINSEDIRPMHVAWALTKICKNLSKDPADIWWARAGAFREDFESQMKEMRFVYDTEEDELPDDVKVFRPSFRR